MRRVVRTTAHTHTTQSAQPEASPTSPESGKSVRIVALTFDLQDGEHEIAENQNVRAVICEHFFIGDDDDDVVFTVNMYLNFIS